MKIQAELDISTISQRLFYHGVELQDNSATLGSLGVLSHDTMDLKEEPEDIELLASGTEDDRPRRRREERGFGGTLLGYSSSSSPSRSTSRPAEDVESTEVILSCPACTYNNVPDAFSCAMCDTVLGTITD